MIFVDETLRHGLTRYGMSLPCSHAISSKVIGRAIEIILSQSRDVLTLLFIPDQSTRV